MQKWCKNGDALRKRDERGTKRCQEPFFKSKRFLTPFSSRRRLPQLDQESDTGKFYRPSRDGQRLIAGHFDPSIAKQLKLLAAEEDTTVQALLEEALNLLFVKKGQGTMRNV